MPIPELASLHVFPIKSAGGFAVTEAVVDSFGLRYDRRWMLVDDRGVFLTQRTHHRMALLAARVVADRLVVDAPRMPTLTLPLEAADAPAVDVQVWRDRCRGLDLGDEARRWFTAFLDTPCRLVFMPEGTVRSAERLDGAPASRVAFADAYPFLLLSKASLADLNSRLPVPIGMNRFRPNLVVRGTGPYAEDGWHRLRIGGIAFEVVKPCARCVIPTVDQATGIAGREPLRTLAGYRRVDGKVLFGQNAVHLGTGRLAVGDPVLVESTRAGAFA